MQKKTLTLNKSSMNKLTWFLFGLAVGYFGIDKILDAVKIILG